MTGRKSSAWLMVAAALIGLLGFSSPTLAVPAIDFGAADVVGTFASEHQRVVGWQFTTNTDVTVTHLGFFDADGDGLSVAHDVGLYTGDGTLLVSGTVPSGTSGLLTGLFRYVDVADVTLAAGTLFVIAASVPGNTDRWTWFTELVGVNVLNPVVVSSITLGGPGTARFECCSSSALEFPDQMISSLGDGRIAFLGPNFLTPTTTQPVPEASTLLLVCLGLVLLGLGLKKMPPLHRHA